jgi:hypothetical protein
VSTPDAAEIQRIETALQEWRQGDATLDDGTFLVHLADKRTPLTAAARASVDDVPVEFNLYEVLTSVTGLAVVSQSCDIVKKCADCEYVDVSPLVKIDVAAQLQAIRKGQQLRYAYLPGLAPQNLVVDIGRTMTVEKAVLAGWNRIPGCITDQDRVDFADALARKRQRFAFPDIFNAGLTKFRNRLKEKEGKASAEGALIAASSTKFAFNQTLIGTLRALPCHFGFCWSRMQIRRSTHLLVRSLRRGYAGSHFRRRFRWQIHSFILLSGAI